MDLPTCPSCGQSVLDDDATECPFCGSSMSAPRTAKSPQSAKKPAAEPPKSAPQESSEKAPVKAEAVAAAQKRPKGGALFGPTVEVNADEMIASDQEAMKRAFPARRQPEKGCRHKVICPMCEAPGFIPEKAMGHEVRCHNPHCMVPIFTAPAAEKKVVEPEKKSFVLSPVFIVSGSAVLLLLVIGLVFWLTSSDSKKRNRTPLVNSTQVANNNSDSENDETETPEKDPQPVKKALILDKEDTYARLTSAARRVPRNRKPFARRWTTELAARMGRLAEADEQLRHLESVGQTVMFLEVPPLAEIGWETLSEGNMDQANQTADAALVKADRLRQQGRFQYDATLALAGLLAALDRDAEALNLIKSNYSAGEDAGLAADLYVALYATKFDFGNATESTPIGGWRSPLFSALPSVMVTRGKPEAAQRWLQSANSDAQRTEAASIWADFLLRKTPQAELSTLPDLIIKESQSLSQTGRGLVLSRAAFSASAREEATVTATLAEAAREALKDLKAPESLKFPNVKSIIYYRFPDWDPHLIAAQAFGELARLEIVLGNTAEGLAALQTGLQYARQIGPTKEAVRNWKREMSQSGPRRMEQLIKSELSLPNDDEARRQYAVYDRHVERLKELAEERENLQVAMIESVVAPPSLEAIDKLLVDSRAADAEEDFTATKVPWLLVEQFQLSGNVKRADTIAKQVPDKQMDRMALQVTEIRLYLGNHERTAELANALSGLPASRTEKEREILILLSDVVREGHWLSALRIARRLEDKGIAEEALLLLSAQASVLGHAAEIVDWSNQEKPDHNEAVSLYCGALLGTTVEPAPPKVEKPVDAKPDKTADES